MDCFIRFGDSTVVATATDLFLAASDTRIYSVGAGKTNLATHIAVIRDSVDGRLYISERE